MEIKQINSGVIFDENGRVDPESLVGMPEELIARVTSPEFQAQAAREIREAKQREQFLADAQSIRRRAHLEHEQRRPSGVSGRQRKRLRKLARLLAQPATEQSRR